MMKSYILLDMTCPEIKDALKTTKVAIVPVGAQEQHGYHIALGCDSYRAEKFSELLAERTFPIVVVTPIINFGVSPQHIDFPGMITLRQETLMNILEDIVANLRHRGVENFLIVNTHGGN